MHGQIKVHKVVCAIDCGLAVNPDGVRAQMESPGSTLAYPPAFTERSPWQKEKVQQSNFHDYRIAGMNDTPLDIEVYIVNSTEKNGWGRRAGRTARGPRYFQCRFRSCRQTPQEFAILSILTSKRNYYGQHQKIWIRKDRLPAVYGKAPFQQ